MRRPAVRWGRRWWAASPPAASPAGRWCGSCGRRARGAPVGVASHLRVAAAARLDAAAPAVGDPAELLQDLLAVGDAAGDAVERLAREQERRPRPEERRPPPPARPGPAQPWGNVA